jgi:hypothetical protein
MAEVGASAAISPTSNLFLGSGFFDYAASDVAARFPRATTLAKPCPPAELLETVSRVIAPA